MILQTEVFDGKQMPYSPCKKLLKPIWSDYLKTRKEIDDRSCHLEHNMLLLTLIHLQKLVRYPCKKSYNNGSGYTVS